MKKGAHLTRLRQLGSALWHTLRTNWPRKLLALVLAVALWAGLITQDANLTREKTFTDVAVSVVGSDTLKRNGLIVTSDLTSLLSGVTLHAEVPQGQYNNVTASNYNPRIDLSRITGSGEQELRILANTTTAYGSVVESNPASVTLTVEEYATRYRVPVTVETLGSMPEGWYATGASIDPPMLTVSGPRSLVDRVRRAEAVVDLSALPAREGELRSAVDFRLLDAMGETIEDRLLEVMSEGVLLDTVIVEQTIYPQRTLDLNALGLVVGTPAHGYEIRSVVITPAQVTGAGTAETLEQLDTLYTESIVDVTGHSESFTRQLRVTRPPELVWLSQSTFTVAVEIGESIAQRRFTGVRIRAAGQDAGMRAALALQTADVVVEGPQLWLEGLSASDLTLTVDLSGLAEGRYTLPILCALEGDGYTAAVEPETVQVTVSAR